MKPILTLSYLVSGPYESRVFARIYCVSDACRSPVICSLARLPDSMQPFPSSRIRLSEGSRCDQEESYKRHNLFHAVLTPPAMHC